MSNPIDPEAIKAMFAPDSAGIWRLVEGESDQHECKASFGFKHPGAWLRAVAALANNRGGYVLFGVHDKDKNPQGAQDMSYAVIGLKNEEFSQTDPSEIAKRLRSTFDPTPHVKATTALIGGKWVGVLFVEKHPSRPVIASRSDEKIAEGDIFYRYPGVSANIKYSDLRAVLDEQAKELTSVPVGIFIEDLTKRTGANSAGSTTTTAPSVLSTFGEAWAHLKAKFWGDLLSDTHLRHSVVVSWSFLLLPTFFLLFLEFAPPKSPFPTSPPVDTPFFWFDGLVYTWGAALVFYSHMRWSHRKRIRGWQ